MLKIIEFMNEHKDWEAILTQAPYHLRVARKGCYILLKYDQRISDFSNPLVKECRGIIIKEIENGYKPVCVPFYKFFNYGEIHADEIDWSTAKTTEKIDGSLIKIWWDEGVRHISTNGGIDAGDIDLPMPFEQFETFLDLVNYALERDYKDFEWDTSRCYMFEVVSPYSKIVISYPEIRLYWLSSRNMETLEEIPFDPSWKWTPKIYDLHSLSACISSAEELASDGEGYVVSDAQYNRVKVKSPMYVAMHHTISSPTYRSILTLIKANEVDEYLGYFPELSDIVLKLQGLCNDMKNGFINDAKIIDEQVRKIEGRKEQAMFIKNNCYCPNFSFAYLDNKITSIDDYVSGLRVNYILRKIGLYGKPL